MHVNNQFCSRRIPTLHVAWWKRGLRAKSRFYDPINLQRVIKKIDSINLFHACEQPYLFTRSVSYTCNVQTASACNKIPFMWPPIIY